MSAPKLTGFPGQDEPMVLSNGHINPNWYLWLKSVDASVRALRDGGVLGALDVDNSTPITNGQVLVWDNTAKKFKGGAN
jgi:hypothetical protein